MVPSNTRKVLKVMTTTSVKIPLQPTSHFLEKRKRDNKRKRINVDH